jgi:siroheme synthase-like protein
VKGYPIFLVHLDRARCVVVGGGKVAVRKVSGLRKADARVVVISPQLCDRLEELAASDAVEVVRRAYRRGDLEGAALAIAATDDPDVNRRVWEEAQERGLPVNVVDDPAHCTFIAPSVVRRGPLTLAISTSGYCPALSRHLRQRLEREFGPAYADYVALLGELRERAVDELALDERRVFWKRVFQSDVLALLASGDEAAARHRAKEILDQTIAGGD